jgi:glycosyltransferase involved in cell wall biosynthesis
MERQTHLLCDKLCRLGHQVDIITTSHPKGQVEESKVENQRIIYLGGTEPGKYSTEWWGASRKMFEILHSTDPYDVIHSQSIGGYGILQSAKESRIPVVATCHGTPISDTRTHLVTHRLRSRLVGMAGTLMYLPHHFSVYQSSKAVIAVSSQIKDHLVRFRFVRPHAVTVIPNGTNTETFTPTLDGGQIRSALSIGEKRMIFFIGRLVEEKGAQYAIRALPKVIKEVGDVVLVIAGRGLFQPQLRELANSLGVSKNIVFAGFVSEEELPYYYASSDVLVFPTTHVEGFPLVLAEALASGLPIVSSNIGGTPAAISHGETGFLFEPRDVGGLSSFLIRLLSDDGLREEMAEKSRNVSLRKFSAIRMAEQTLEVYRLVSQDA